MSKKVTKKNEILEKVDNEIQQQENKSKSMQWNELDKCIGQPIWDSRDKKWRILEGYKRIHNTYCITFTDTADWISYYDRNLYLEEVN